MNYIVKIRTDWSETESRWNDLGAARRQAARLIKVWRKAGAGMTAAFVPLRWIGANVEIEVLREHADGRLENFRKEEGGEPDYDMAVKYPNGWEKQVNF